MRKIAKFGREVFCNRENIALYIGSLHILYIRNDHFYGKLENLKA